MDLRCLVATPIQADRNRLTAAMSAAGIEPVVVHSAEAAASTMSNGRFDVVFVDADPTTDEMLAPLRRVSTQWPPRTIVGVAPANRLATLLETEWARVAGHFLASPFTLSEVDAVLEKARWEASGLKRRVVLLGEGLWADAVAKVMSSRHVPVLITSGPEGLRGMASAQPGVVVVGPPFTGPALLAACAEIRRDGRFNAATLAAALEKADTNFTLHLLTIGADRAFVIENEIAALSDELLRLAHGIRREHERVELHAPVVIRSGSVARAGTLFDIGAGGLGLATWSSFSTGQTVLAELKLPERAGNLSLRSRVAWTRREGALVRIGLTFDGPQSDRTAIAEFLSTAA
jgi:hypothetical protein